MINPGFENDLTDWTPWHDAGMSTAEADAARSGKLGLRIKDESMEKGSGLESLAVEAVPGKTYEVSFWMKTSSGEGTAHVSLRFFDESGKALQKKKPGVSVGPTPDWTQHSVKAAAPERSVGFVVVIQSIAFGVVTASLDDFEVREIP